MKPNKRLIITFFATFLSGCGSINTRPVNIVSERVTICSQYKKPSPITMRRVDPTVIKDENGIYWIGITPKHYENLSLNLNSMLIYIKQQKAIIKYLKSCIRQKEKQKSVYRKTKTDS